MSFSPNGQDGQITSFNFLNPYGIFMPQIRKELISYQNTEYFIQDILEELQQKEVVRGTTWSTYVEPMIEQTLVASAAASAGAADAAVDIVVQATPGISGGLYARERFVIKNMRTGQSMTIVNAVRSTLTITVLPSTGTNILATNAGDVFIIVGSSNVEGATRVTSLTGVPKKLDFNVQIFEEASSATSFSQQDITWFDVPEADQKQFGLPARCWYSWQLMAASMLYRQQHNKTMLVGEADTLDVSAYNSQWGADSSDVMYQTSGLHPQVRANGSVQENVNTWAAFQLLENVVIANHGDRENFMFHGNQWGQANANWMIDMFKNGAINYGAFKGDKEIAVKIGFNSLTTPGGFTWHFKPLHLYDDPQGLGASSSRYSGGALVIPTMPIKVYSGAGGEGASMARPLRFRYKPLLNGAVTSVAVTIGRSYSAQPTEASDIMSCTHTSVAGFELLAPWKAIEVPGDN